MNPETAKGFIIASLQQIADSSHDYFDKHPEKISVNYDTLIQEEFGNYFIQKFGEDYSDIIITRDTSSISVISSYGIVSYRFSSWNEKNGVKPGSREEK